MKNNKKNQERENFCIRTIGLSRSERKELATELHEFVNDKKSEFTEKRNELEEAKEEE